MLLKNKIWVISGAIFLLIGTLSTSAQQTKPASILQTIVLEDYELDANGNPKRTWALIPDRFGRKDNVESGESLQQLRWVKAWPEAYFGTEKASGKGEFFFGPKKDDENAVRYTDKSGTCLGMFLQFNRQGYNSVEVMPLTQADGGKYKFAPIPFKGKVRQIDFWVWGANYNYFMELVLRDYRGVEYRLDVGSIRHIGWKNFVIQIPNNIPQSVVYRPAGKSLSLVKMVVWTHPTEKVSGAYLYIDHIKYLADVYEDLFDGYKLEDEEYVKNLAEKAPVQPKESDIVKSEIIK